MRDPPVDQVPMASLSERQGVAGMRLPSLRSSLYALVWVCVLPAVGLAAYLAVVNYRLERERVYAESLMRARQVAADLDRELAAMESGLKVLASSQFLAQDDWERFHAQARQAVPTQIVYNYVLTDEQGRQVLNTVVPWGSPLPSRGTPPEIAGVFLTGETVLTDLFIGPVVQRPVLAMGVPVWQDGRVRYSLNIGLDTDALNMLLQQEPLPPGWLMAVLDRKGVIIARSRAAERFVGQPAVPAVVEAIRRTPEGSVQTVTKEGIPSVSSHHRIDRWGWTVAVGVHRDLIEQPLRRGLATVLIVGGAVLAVGLWLALRIMRRVLAAAQGINAAALAIEKGQPVTLPPVVFSEAQAVAAALTRAAEAMGQVQNAATHDALTGLPNRRLFTEMAQQQLAQAQRSGARVALLALDLDHFKAVNDTHGHAAGDQLLREVAARLQSCVRSADVIARLGGDEFLVLMGQADVDAALDLAQRLIESLSAPYPGVKPAVSTSVGIALYPDSAQTLEALMQAADEALYAAKHAGRGRPRQATGSGTGA
ncbi:diguanylate cyclase domain-containing protein [Tepidimonas sp.]|uniref:GGDEF domain-containing protein n=1 Tax=Tepidimonas sp. TaxID=2002775 RepID=UPI00391B82F4